MIGKGGGRDRDKILTNYKKETEKIIERWREK